ncbi:MAG: lipopolysaccharide biosynthesis protein, partial [Cytophagales bacterium]|nr:lipopolysaccharide biosynthesis protein [Cytophagales bacterium]
GIYYNLSIWFKITDQTQYSFYITLIGAIVTIIIILTLVPVLGFIGGALSTFGSYLVMTLLCYFIGQKYYPIPYQTKKDVGYLLIAFFLSYGGFLIDTGSLAFNFILHSAIILLYAGLIFLMEKKELNSLLKSFSKK